MARLRAAGWTRSCRSICVAGLDGADPAFPEVCPRAAWKGHGPLSQLGGPRAGVAAALGRLAVTERGIT